MYENIIIIEKDGIIETFRTLSKWAETKGLSVKPFERRKFPFKKNGYSFSKYQVDVPVDRPEIVIKKEIKPEHYGAVCNLCGKVSVKNRCMTGSCENFGKHLIYKTK